MKTNKDILIQEKYIRASFKNSEEELRKNKWSEIKINLLKKHLGFYFGLINGYVPAKTNKHLEFIENIKNKKKTNIHEETYLDFCNFLNKKRLNNTKKRKDELLYTIDELPHYNDF